MRSTMALCKRLQLIGKVISMPKTMQKTAKVEVTRLVRHPVVEKVIKKRSKYLVHDASDARMPGDIVKIEECPPISKRKHFNIIEIIQEAERFEHPVTKQIVTKASDL
eukprot:TRINITY_DN3289_c0_g1_i1.p1 TRINITY_DN3289_c0_g1~~TRINITY_DN3289_c0_g1_i1.p1  ORF type:complete len:108 (+),score=19.30 TRINITY_DN3289_c0_g1_i1:137-460(+)